MKTVHAVYDKGVFRPTTEVELPQPCEVEFEPRIIGQPDDPQHLARLQEILSRRYASGQTDLAARHNEHQP
jgi:predicted DNA-binding antitoxin AbrB/MazE fold protein